MNYNAVSFPGLGIGQIKLDPEINITENFSIHWYAVIICIGMVVAFFVCNRLRKHMGINEDDFLDCIIFGIPMGVIGARLTYVLGDIKNFHSFMDVIAVWDGGLAIYGGIAFALITVIVTCKIKKCDFRKMLDVMAIGFLIGQIIGRWGNFVNIEVYGVETSLPWAMGIGYYGYDVDTLVHPLFLYESLWNLIGFVLIYGYRDLRKFNGEIFLWYVAWYGLGRGLLEPLRDSTYNLHLFGVRIMMVVAFATCAAAVVSVIIFRRRSAGYIIENPLPKKEIKYDKQFKIDMSDVEMTAEEYESKKLYDAMDNALEQTEEEQNDSDN